MTSPLSLTIHVNPSGDYRAPVLSNTWVIPLLFSCLVCPPSDAEPAQANVSLFHFRIFKARPSPSHQQREDQQTWQASPAIYQRPLVADMSVHLYKYLAMFAGPLSVSRFQQWYLYVPQAA